MSTATHGRQYAVNVEAFTALWNRGTHIDRIAAAIGCTTSAVSYKVKALGLKPRGKGKPGAAKSADEIFVRMWEAGVSTGAMAERFGYSNKGSVSHRRQRLGLPERERGKKTITLEEFAEIELGRRMAEEARKTRRIA